MVQAGIVLVIALLSGVDQWTKAAVIKHLEPIGTSPLIDGFIRLHYVENTGAIFGSMRGNTVALAILTGVIIVVALYLLLSKRIQPVFLRVCMMLVTAGGIGNLIDRVFRGYVIDYIEFEFVNFAIFNFADCLVTVGAFSIIGYLIFDLVKDIRKAKNDKQNIPG